MKLAVTSQLLLAAMSKNGSQQELHAPRHRLRVLRLGSADFQKSKAAAQAPSIVNKTLPATARRLAKPPALGYLRVMSVTVRFAPSPTGRIHIGNARTALFNWLFARQRGGTFILRFDDTDLARSRQEYAEGIRDDLAWLGIEPDRIEYQSKRFTIYDAAVERLKAAGLLYPCYETADELERRRRQRLSRRLPPVYGREALRLTEAEKAEMEAEGRRPHWRFLLPNFASDPQEPERTEVSWDDLVRGPQAVDLASMSDPVLVREDGSYLYTLPSVVDDIEMAVTHVIRGDDHVTNTAVADRAVQGARARSRPASAHHNLLTSVTGEGLSKRSGSLSIAGLREQDLEPMAVASLAVLVGTSENVAAMATMDELGRALRSCRRPRIRRPSSIPKS